MLIFITALFMGLTPKPLYMLSFITSYFMFYYVSLSFNIIFHSDFMLLFVCLACMVWNTMTVVLYIQANYELEEYSEPVEVIRRVPMPVAYVAHHPAGTKGVPTAVPAITNVQYTYTGGASKEIPHVPYPITNASPIDGGRIPPRAEEIIMSSTSAYNLPIARPLPMAMLYIPK